MDSPLANQQWEKHTWKSGEEITEDKLNAIEQKLEDLAGPAMHAIRYDIRQDLSEEEKQRVKKNFNITSTVGSHAMGEDDKNKAYILGTITAPVEDSEVTATMVADPGVYLDTHSGSLTITGAFSQGRKADTVVGTDSFASGWDVEASGFISHAEGNKTIAYGDYSHTEGTGTSAIGKHSHVEGEGGTISKGVIKLTGDEDEDTYTFDTLPSNMSDYDNNYHYYLFYKNKSIGVHKIYPDNHKIILDGTFSEALNSQEVNVYAFPTVAFGNGSHAEGYHTVAQGWHSHAEGYETVADTKGHAEGWSTRAGMSAHAEGSDTIAEGPSSHSEGSAVKAKGISSHAEGADTIAEGQNAHAEGEKTDAKGKSSHVEGTKTVAIGNSAHAEGIGLDSRTGTIILTGASKATTYKYNNLPGGFLDDNIDFYYIFNNNKYYLITNINAQKKEITLQQTLSTTAITSKTFNIYAFDGVASGVGAHSEGRYTAAAGDASHAEGGDTSAIGGRSHAEGDVSQAHGFAAHAEGKETKAIGNWSHAEGYRTEGVGDNSHAEGENTIAKNKSQHVFGRYNEADSSANSAGQYGNYVEIVGNGTDNSTRRNARTLDWNGNEVLAGSITINNATAKSDHPQVHMLDAFVQGTQDKAQAAWLGTAPFATLNDKQIIYYWLPRDSADGGVTLKLTLSNGSTTDNIPVYTKGNTRAGSAYKANSFIIMMYRENIQISTNNTIAKGWWICA